METSSVIPLAKIFFVFMAMLAGIKFRLGIGTSILGGSVLTGLLFGIPAWKWVIIAGESLLDLKLILLAIIVLLIMILSRIMENTGQNKRLMHELSGLLKWPRFRLAFFPALIGLLPMPGGAVFSAPMVKSAALDQDLANKDKILINYWFRHIWELIWPLYPGLILAAHFSGIPLVRLLGYTWPGLLVCLILGWFFFLRPLKIKPPKNNETPRFKPRKAFYESLPLAIAIVGSLSLEALVWSFVPSVYPEVGLVAGLFLAISVCSRQNRVSLTRVLAFAGEKHLWQMLFVVLAIFVFKGTLDNGEIVREISSAIAGPGTLLAAAAVIPLMVGVISGITIAFVGATFPLILGIVDQLGIEANAPYVVLGLFAGLAGVMVSPIHICFILTCEFFHTNLASVWPKLILPCLLLFLSGLGYFFILS
jgi:integral membrane protein (TIGR00529 family)